MRASAPNRLRPYRVVNGRLYIGTDPWCECGYCGHVRDLAECSMCPVCAVLMQVRIEARAERERLEAEMACTFTIIH